MQVMYQETLQHNVQLQQDVDVLGQKISSLQSEITQLRTSTDIADKT
jgi:hypothetical protein